MMNALTQQMNKVLADWKEKFDLTASLPMRFTPSPDGHLCFNGSTVFPAKDTFLESSRFTASRIQFSFADKRHLVLRIEWPEDEPPQLACIYFGKCRFPKAHIIS